MPLFSFGRDGAVAFVLLSVFAIGCSHAARSTARPKITASNAASSAPSLAFAPSAPSDAGGVAQKTASVRAGANAAVATPLGEDFAEPARELFRAAACGGKDSIPPRLDRAIVATHCIVLRQLYDRYRARWLTRAVPFIGALRPAVLPPRVVYPFGGGDLVTALAVFPDAERYTTISLEPAGDVRTIDRVTPKELKGALGMNRRHLKKLLGLTYSRTTNLGLEGRAALPGEIIFMMAGFAIHGYEPVSLRYFSIEEDGALRYLDAEGLARADAKPHAFGDPPLPEFTNVEIGFRRDGETSTRIVRHIAQDLSDKELEKAPGLLRYLASEGRVAAMTKAASHLLWADEFSLIRTYLLDHAEWMISDSTGIPPRFAGPAGFVEDTFGHFDGPAKYGPIEPRDAKDFRKLFMQNPLRPLSFQFGYADVHRQIHMIVMRRQEHASSE